MPVTDAEAVARVRAALAAHPQTRALADAGIERLPGGVAERGWRVTWQGERWFVRLDRRDRRSLGADPDSEARLLQFAAGLGIAPRLLACEPATGLLVTEYVEGRTWSEADFQDPVALRRLGALLARLHAAPAQAGVRRLDFAEQANRLGGDATRFRGPARDMWARIDSTRRAPVPCHNDLHAENVIEDARQPWLVDWEYGGLGDPLFDLAPVLAGLRGNDSLRAALFAGYGALTPDDAAAIGAVGWYYDYVQWLWYRAWLEQDRHPEPGLRRRLETLELRLLREAG